MLPSMSAELQKRISFNKMITLKIKKIANNLPMPHSSKPWPKVVLTSTSMSFNLFFNQNPSSQSYIHVLSSYSCCDSLGFSL